MEKIVKYLDHYMRCEKIEHLVTSGKMVIDREEGRELREKDDGWFDGIEVQVPLRRRLKPGMCGQT